MTMGCFALKDNDKVVIRDGCLVDFMRADPREVCWHREGKLQINDIVIYVGDRAAESGLDRIPDLDVPADAAEDGCIEVIIFKYGNRDYVPFCKKTDIKSAGITEKTLADTIYSAEKIKITASREDGRVFITFHVNDRQKTRQELGKAGALLIIKNEGIGFFSSPENTSETLKAVLAGEAYGAYYDYGEPVSMGEFFDENICAAIRDINRQDDPVIFEHEGKPAAVMMLLDKRDENERIYQIGDEKGFLEDIRRRTGVYDELYFKNEIKTADNEPGCEARLRGCGKIIEEINKKLDKVCRKNVTIVLTGESGTGKTFLARQIHKNSRRSEGPFINVNCAVISYNLIESELFGYEDGAFTGARRGGKPGYFELAKGGTLFLDEISELPFLLQGKLLEVLQEGTFYRVGGTRKISSDVRLITATNKDLEKMVKNGSFREDLYYRINVFPINLPPLKERISDLYSIIGDTLPDICERLEIDNLMLTNPALEKMKKYSWPGNIRELENVLEKAAVMAEGSFIREEDIVLDTPVGRIYPETLKEKLAEYEKEIIKSEYEKFNGNRRKMAEALGISKTNLFDKLNRYGIEKEFERRESDDSGR